MVAATRGLDRGRTDQGAVDAAYRADLARWIDVQQKAALDFFSDGLLRWQDLFRPLVAGLGPEPHTLVRWLDTNTFYREPEFPQGISRASSTIAALPDASVPQPRVITLPSPYVFSRVAKSAARDQLMSPLASNVLRPVIDTAVRGGTRLIHLEEPWLAYEGIEDASWSAFSEALEILHRGVNATLALHIYFGNAAPHIARLKQLPVDALGIDLVQTDVAALGRGWDKGLIAGLVNGRVSRLESLDGLVTAAQLLADQVKPRDLYLTSNTELSYLPTRVAEQKVERLGQAADRLKELVSV